MNRTIFGEILSRERVELLVVRKEQTHLVVKHSSCPAKEFEEAPQGSGKTLEKNQKLIDHFAQ